MRTLVIGAGSTGGYFGGRLAAAGRDVTFLVRPGRAARLRADGLVIHSPHGNLRLTPKLVTADALTDDYDLVLFTVKAYAAEQAIADIAPAIGPDTMILPMLNGMRHIDLLTERYSDKAVLGGVCLVATVLDADGSVHQLTGLQELAYGDRQDPGSARIHDVHAGLTDAGFTARLSDDIVMEMWEKWVFLASIGAVTCLMRGSVGQVVAAAGGREFAERVVAECAAVAAASGQPVSDSALNRTLATVTEAGATTNSSMYRDLQQGNPVEADHIIGDLIDRARQHGVDVPLLRLTYTHLSVYQSSVAG
ncbi:MAG: 2-dehydropantoate 2-reductase [Pseudonocardiales bacterium]|jgi:2-dehydropantoate 2-reductase|nr:2-dehydropantoate 2-reductase [Pseudonocardiales bacterium]